MNDNKSLNTQRMNEILKGDTFPTEGENYLDEDIVRGIVEYAHEHDLYIQMYDEGTIVVEKLRLERHPDPDLRYADYREVGNFLEYPFFNTPKILLACEPERVPVEQAALEELFGERVYMAQSDAHLIEVVSEGVDKGVALEHHLAFFPSIYKADNLHSQKSGANLRFFLHICK